MDLKKEAFLSDFCIEFQQNFQLMDLALSSSEVNLYHLKIPKSKLFESRIKTEPSIAPLPDDTPKNMSKNVEQSTPPSKIAKNASPEEGEDRTQPSPPPTSEEQNYSPSSSKKHSRSRPDGSSTVKILSLEEYWLPDISTGKSISYLFTVEKRNDKIIYAFVEEDTRETVMRAVCSSGGEIRIVNGKEIIGGFSFEDGGIVYAYVNLNGKEIEIASAILHNDAENSNDSVQFCFMVPSLRKNSSGALRFFVLPRSEKSLLVEKYNNKQKGVIDCMTKPKDEIVKLFENQHKSNFILNPSLIKGFDVLSFQYIDSGVFRTEIRHPFSPLQGFIGCMVSQLCDLM